MITHNHNVQTDNIQVNDSNSNLFANTQGGTTQVALSSYINTLTSPHLQSQMLSQVGNPTNPSSTNKKKGATTSNNVARNDNHKHKLQSGPQTINANVQVSFYWAFNSQFASSKNVNIGNEGNDDEYIPPYAYIGFIMKDPDTWL